MGSSTDPLDLVEQLLNGAELNGAELALRELTTEDFVRLLSETETGHLPSPAEFDALVTYLDHVPARRDRGLLHPCSRRPPADAGIKQGRQECHGKPNIRR